MNKKVLIVLSEKFPYGTGETFLEAETKYWNGFDMVYVVPLGIMSGDEKSRSISWRVIDTNFIGLSGFGKMKALLKLINDKLFMNEMKVIHKNKYGRRAIRTLISMTVNMQEQYSRIQTFIDSNISENDSIYLYSYWLYNSAYVASLLRNNNKNVVKAVSRGHGFDVYEERSGGYLPYRRLIFERLDEVFCVSRDGAEHIKMLYPEYCTKINHAYLGTEDFGEQHYEKAEKVRIISCSSCIPLKRLDRIIETLSLFNEKNIKIEWTHYGAGNLLNSLISKARESLTPNIHVEFKGFITNAELMECYKNNIYDLFINVSETEGVPVSIMEAMSFGIPAIATDVGGTSELVINGKNGFLLKKNFSNEELYEKIVDFTSMNYEDCMKLRTFTREFWKSRFSAKRNYTEYMNAILTITKG